MIRPSPELEATTRRYEAAIEAKDLETVRNLLSESEYLRFLGSAQGELWSGDVVREGFPRHIALATHTTLESLSLEAFENGACGWSISVRLQNFEALSEPLEMRNTLVYALNGGRWQIVHRHASFPRSNLQILGFDPTILDDLMQAAEAEGPIEAYPGTTTVMFTDIVGSSALAEAMGDAPWAKVVAAHIGQVTDAVGQSGGRLVKSLGDGTMSIFGSAAGAMTSASAIQQALSTGTDEPRLQVRIGLHTGDVIEAGDDFFGTVVNKAARVAATAGPGEIRVSDATRAMVGGSPEFAFGDPVTLGLKGLEGQHVIHRLEWARR